jgi:hypothetical protein
MTSPDLHPVESLQLAQNDELALRAQLAAMPPDAVFDTTEAAVYCKTGESTWERMRAKRQTPPAIQLTGRTLGYRKRVLDAWLDARTEQDAA